MVEQIGGAEGSALFTDEEKAVLAASAELTRTARLSEVMIDRLKQHFDDRAIVELVVNTSIANLNNRMTDSFVADLEQE